LESLVSAITQTCIQAIVIVIGVWFCVSNILGGKKTSNEIVFI
jgi:hypothetical protein